MILTFEAIDAQGNKSSDTIEASGMHEASELLRGRGLYITSLAEQKKTATKAAPRIKATDVRLPLKTLTLFTRQMAMLLGAGSAVVPALQAIRRQMTKPTHKALLGQLVNDLEEGQTLTETMRKYTATFDPVYCAITAAGEASGAMARMFERLALIVGKRRAMRNKIIGAMAYPALLIAMSTKIILVLMLFVLPRFDQMFIQLGVEAPAMTRYLLATGAFLRAYWLPLAVGVAFLVTGVVAGLKSKAGRRWLSDVQLLIPGVGRLRSRLIQGQILRTMGTLLESRVGLLDTLELAREATSNRQYQKLFDQLENAVTGGGQLSTAFEASGLVEPYICQAVRTGEDCGSLGSALTYCADILDETNTELLTTLTRLIEPAILIGMGLVVGAVAVSLFLPLFDMTSAIK